MNDQKETISIPSSAKTAVSPGTSKHKRKRTRPEREQDLILIGKMWFEKKPPDQIAAYISQNRPYQLSVAQVRYDLREIEGRMKPRTTAELERLRDIHLSKLDDLHSEALQAWERSKEDRRAVRKIEGESGEVRRVLVQEKRDGDPRFLETVARILDRRAKLLGLYKNKPETPPKSKIQPQITPAMSARFRVASRTVMIAEIKDQLRKSRAFPECQEQMCQFLDDWLKKANAPDLAKVADATANR